MKTQQTTTINQIRHFERSESSEQREKSPEPMQVEDRRYTITSSESQEISEITIPFSNIWQQLATMTSIQ